MNNIICRPRPFLVAKLVLAALTTGLNSEATRKTIHEIKMDAMVMK